MSQQDQVDQIEYHARNARAHTECGADEIQKQNLGYMCGALNVQEGEMFKNIGSRQGDPTTVQEELKWSTPFETITDDFKDVVHNDLLSFGKDIVVSSKQKISVLAEKTACKCHDESVVMSDEEEVKA